MKKQVRRFWYLLFSVVFLATSLVGYAGPAAAWTITPAPIQIYLAPTVTSVSPNYGAPGTVVTITGTNFDDTATVRFGTVAATSSTLNSATSITATAPTASGTVDITVATDSGTSDTNANDQFTYSAGGGQPAVASVSPNSGPTTGGTVVTITGTNFPTAAATPGIAATLPRLQVLFGDRLATSVTINTDRSITATSPPGSGTVDVRVTTSGGTSPLNPPNDQFTYVVATAAPTVTGIGPRGGPADGGTPVTITGTNFTSGATVSFASAPATGVTVNSATSITATSPAGTGTVDVTVTTSEGTSAPSSADQFNYYQRAILWQGPTVTGISPRGGPETGGDEVTIMGSGFTGATQVKFGSTAAVNFTVEPTDTEIMAITPPGTGTVDVTVTTPGGTSATGTGDEFDCTPATPSSGQVVIRFYVGRSDYYVNGQAQSMNSSEFGFPDLDAGANTPAVTPVISGGRTLLPIRFVATPLGATVNWDQAAQKVTVTLGGKTIELWIGQNTAKVNGVVTPIDPNNPDVTPLIIPPGRTMLPLRFIAGNLGCQVNWDQSQQEVTVINRVALNPQPLPPG